MTRAKSKPPREVVWCFGDRVMMGALACYIETIEPPWVLLLSSRLTRIWTGMSSPDFAAPAKRQRGKK
jgi:uncharacterized membrane protein